MLPQDAIQAHDWARIETLARRTMDLVNSL
jgi:hypothetical protein